MKLAIANKAYSSWSLRPWLLLRVFNIAFDEIVIPLDTPGSAAAIRAFGPAGKLPVLVDGTLTIWDSLAIIEYVAETHGEKAIWPRDRAARAVARALAAEMHSGFLPLRRALPMNLRRQPRPARLDAETTAAVAADVARLEQAWADSRARFGGAGAFLFGDFSAADAMFAPVVNRLHVYAQEVSADTRAYMDAVMALPAWRDWQAGAEAEGWQIARYDDA